MTPYKPDNLPLKNIDWSALVDLMGKANRYIARYDGLLQSIINPDVLLSPLRTQEAVLSSQIEGTQATLEEVLEFEADERKTEGNKKDDIFEIINYRIALKHGKERMETKPLTLRVIRDMHKYLMHDVRGQSKDPGNFRRIQNFIGAPGSRQEDARFVPPNVLDMKKALDNWEKYLHYEDTDVLVQLAIVHAQFVIIHPFLDGNGRIGRILIPLFLYHKRIIQEPVFYLSEYLETNRKDYYDSLKNITDRNDWTSWIRFFLNAIIIQAEKNIKQTRSIIQLYDDTKTRIAANTNSQFSIQCLDTIFSKPFFTSTDFRLNSGLKKNSANRLLKSLVENDIILVLRRAKGSNPTLYVFRKLLDIINMPGYN